MTGWWITMDMPTGIVQCGDYEWCVAGCLHSVGDYDALFFLFLLCKLPVSLYVCQIQYIYQLYWILSYHKLPVIIWSWKACSRYKPSMVCMGRSKLLVGGVVEKDTVIIITWRSAHRYTAIKATTVMHSAAIGHPQTSLQMQQRSTQQYSFDVCSRFVIRVKL